MTVVVATGVFEIIHPGHVLFLEESRRLGDRLVVIVARDANIKKRERIIPEKQRLEVVRSLKPVDEAVLGDEKDIFGPIERIRPDIITLGKDQVFDENELRKELDGRGIKAKVVRIDSVWNGPLSSTKEIIGEIRGL